MQVANRTNRRYIAPPARNLSANIRPTIKKPIHVPPVSNSSPKKAVDTTVQKSNEPSTLKKLVDRFRYDEPQPRPERDSTNSDFWWLHDELKQTYGSDADGEEERKSNIPDFIEIFPSTDIDQDLNKRASLLLNQTTSAHSSDIGQVSSVGIGSTPSSTLTTTTTSTFQPVVREQAARPIFTRITDSRFDLKNDGNDDDILYQWRLRRRLEQAQNGEPITFSSKITSRTNVSPARSFFPPIPIEIPTILPPPLVPTVIQPLSPKPERQQQSSATNTESEPIKQPVTTPVPIRQYSEVATQTLQDACIQTSPTNENQSSSSVLISNESDLHPTRDENQHSSVWHRPPPRSKCEVTRIASSPSPIKRHHHHHHHHSFRPVGATSYLTTNDTSHHQRSMNYPSNTVQSSLDSTLTQVTSIMINDNNSNNNNHMDNHYQTRNNNNNNNSIAIIDESQELQQDDDHIDYSNDEILNILIRKRDELILAFRETEQRLANMNS